MSIYVICGDPGAGKSAYGVKLAEMYAKNDPRPIYSTYWIDVPSANGGEGVRVVTWPEMTRLQKALCIVDESADLFNARDYGKAENKGQIGMFREHRKDGLTLFLVSQGFDMLDTNIRAMTRYVWFIKRMFGPDFYENESVLERRIGVWSLARMYLAKSYTKESEGHKKRVCLRTQAFRVDALYDRFDTLAKSAGLSGTKDTRGAGLAAGSELASERRRASAARRQPRTLPPAVYPLLGLPAPVPRLAAVRMQMTKEEYLSWSRPDRLASMGRTDWHGPDDLEHYDRLPLELQVHPTGGPMPVAKG